MREHGVDSRSDHRQPHPSFRRAAGPGGAAGPAGLPVAGTGPSAWQTGPVVRTEPLERARDHLAELADEVEQKGTHVVLTRFGHDDVVVVSLREWEAMQDAVDLAHDPEAQRRIAESRAAYRSGDYVTGDQLRAEYGLPPL